MKDFSDFDFDSLPDQDAGDGLREQPESTAVLNFAFETDPQQHANALNTSKVSGVPVQAVKGREKQLATINKLKNLNFDNSPVTKQFFNDFDNAVVGQNDIEQLKVLEGRLSPNNEEDIRFGDAFMRGGTNFAESFFRKTYRVRQYNIQSTLDSGDEAITASLNAVKNNPVEINGNGVLKHILKDVPLQERKDFIANLTVSQYTDNLLLEWNRLQRLKYGSIARSKEAEELYGKSGEYTIDRLFKEPSFKNAAGFVLETGTESIPEMLAAMTGVGLVGVGVSTSGRVAESRAKNDKRGEVSERDDLIGSLVALPVVAFEKLGINKALLKKGGFEKLADIPKETLKRVFIEGSTESLQEVIEELGGSVGTETGVDSDKLIKSAVGGALAGAGISSGFQAVKLPFESIELARTKVAEDLIIDDTVAAEQSKIDDIVNTVTEMDLKQLSPEALRSFVKESDGNQNTTVFIKPEKIKEYLSTLTENDVDNDPALITLVSKLNESAALNNDIDIPIDEFVNDFIGSEHFESLRPHMTLKSETPTPSQIEERRGETQSYVEKIIAEASVEIDSSIEAQQIYDTVKDQLVDTGRLSERDAKVAAQLVPAWAVVFAKDNNITVAEAFEQSGLTIDGPLTGKRAELGAEGVLGQSTNGYYDDKNATITLTENANASTFIHEFGHFMYDMERRATGSKLGVINNWFTGNIDAIASESKVTSDQVSRYLSDNTTGDTAVDKKIYIATHEQFARAFETYLMEGKAPSVELRNVFQTIARWMTEIYRSIKGDLDVNLTDDMRVVFDTFLATQDQIAAAEARVELEPLFTEAAMAGKTQEEFEKYKAAKEKVKSKATETLRDKLIKQITRQQQQWWKSEKDDVIVEETTRLQNEKIHKARAVLTSGKIQLSTADVRTVLDTPKGALPAKLNKMRSPDGMDADQAATILGYGSGAELIQTLIETPTLKQDAEAAAQQRMLDKHGDLMNDGSIEQEADNALQNEERGKLLLDELRTLSNLTNQKTPTTRKEMKSLAEENIAKLSYVKMHPSKYRTAEIKAAKVAAVALKEGDVEGARTAKMRQVMNYYLGMEAIKAKAETDKIVSHKTRYRKKSVVQEIQKGDAGHFDQIQNILSRFEFRKSAPLVKDRPNLESFIVERNIQYGETIYTDVYTLNEDNKTHWKNVTFNELKGVDDTIKSLEHVALEAGKVRMGEDVLEFNKVVDDFVTHLDNLPTVENNDTLITPSEKARAAGILASSRYQVKDLGESALSMLSKMPWVASWLDNGERAGMAHELLIQPMVDGYFNRSELHKSVSDAISNELKKASSKDLKKYKKVYYSEKAKNKNNSNGAITGHKVLGMMLYMGNDSNLEKMILGEGWAKEGDTSMITKENEVIVDILSKFEPSKKEWDLVQSILDKVSSLYDPLSAAFVKESGVAAPPKIQPSKIHTEFGVYDGGYIPVNYDRRRSFVADQNAQAQDASIDSSLLNSVGGLRTKVTSRATKERTGFYAPVDLDLGLIDKHLKETIHYIALAEPVKQVNRLLKNKKVAAKLKEKLGSREYDQIPDWLKRIAKEPHFISNPFYKTPVIDAVFARARRGMTYTHLGFNAGTGMLQGSGLLNLIAETGKGNVYKALSDVYSLSKNPIDANIGAYKKAVAKGSKVLPFRLQTYDRDVGEGLQKLKGEQGVLAAAQKASLWHIGMLQMGVDLVSWNAAYNKEINLSGDESKAVRYGDWAIENIQGSGSMYNMSALQAHRNPMVKSLYMFATFAATQFNQKRDVVRKYKAGQIGVAGLAGYAAYMLVFPAIYDSFVKGMLQFEDEEDRKKTAKDVGWRVVDNVTMGIPLVASASSVIKGYGVSNPVYDTLSNGLSSAVSAADGSVTKKELKNITTMIGVFAGVPGQTQGWKTEGAIEQMIEEGEFDFFNLLTGPDK